MSDLQAQIRAELYATVRKYGRDFDLLKYTTNAPANLYRQGTKAFAPAVTLRGIVSYGKFVDRETVVGNLPDHTGRVMVPYTELANNLTFSKINEAITLKDRLGFDDRLWRVVHVQYTSALDAGPEVICLYFASLEGRQEEAYP